MELLFAQQMHKRKASPHCSYWLAFHSAGAFVLNNSTVKAQDYNGAVNGLDVLLRNYINKLKIGTKYCVNQAILFHMILVNVYVDDYLTDPRSY